MKIVKGIAAVYRHITGNFWKATWIEHGKVKSKFIESKVFPASLTFAQIKRKREIFEREILHFIKSASEIGK